MSRGHGSRQRTVVDALCASESARTEGLPLAALPLPVDRSNAHRIIKSLVRRGDAEIVVDEGGGRRLKLGFMAELQAMWKNNPPGYGRRGDTERELRAERRALDEAATDLLAREQQKRRGHILRDRQRWAEPGSALRRHRAPGPHQLRVIAVLVAYAPDPQEGLPTEAVRQIAVMGSGETNATRALDRLLDRGTLQQSRDGARVRLSDWRLSFLHAHVPDLLEPPLDDSKAKAVLEGFDKDRGSHVSEYPHAWRRDAPGSV